MLSRLVMKGGPMRAVLAFSRAAAASGSGSLPHRKSSGALFLPKVAPSRKVSTCERMRSPTAIPEDYYPTRFVKESVAIPRPDPVVWGPRLFEGTKGFLTQEDCDHYEEHGYVVLDGVLNGDTLRDLIKDMKVREAEIDDYVASQGEGEFSFGESRSGTYLTEYKTKRVRSVYHTTRHIPQVYNLARSPELLGAVQHILDDEVYFYQDRINFHSAYDGEGFCWHGDFDAWHSEDGMPRLRAVSVMIMLSENNPSNGALMVMPGTHKIFLSTPQMDDNSDTVGCFQGYTNPAPLDRKFLTEYGEKYGIKYCTGGPGTVVLTDPNIIHGSHTNISPFGRRNLFLVYNAVSNKPNDPYGGKPPRPEYMCTRDPEWQKPLTHWF